MQTELHRQLSLTQDGSLIINQLPFRMGDLVEVTIRSLSKTPIKKDQRYPLRGTPYRYDDPFASAVSAEDWEALK